MPATSRNTQPISPRPGEPPVERRPRPELVAGRGPDEQIALGARAVPHPIRRGESGSRYPSPRRPGAESVPVGSDDDARSHIAPLAPITATGGAVAAAATVGVAAVLDALISPGLGLLFGFVFVLTSVLVALRMGWNDAWAAIALPPLVFVTAAGLAAQVAPVTTGGWVHRTSTDIAVAVLDHPYYLLLGTILAIAAIVHRARVE